MGERGDIGRRVRQARKLAGLRVADIALAVGKLAITVYRWESGRFNPSEDDCRVIAQLTQVSFDWLRTGEGEPREAAA